LRDNCRELYKALKAINIAFVNEVFRGCVVVESIFLKVFLQRYDRLIEDIYPLVQVDVLVTSPSQYSRNLPVDCEASFIPPEAEGSGIILTPIPKKTDIIPNALSSKKRERCDDEFLFTSPNKKWKSAGITQSPTMNEERNKMLEFLTDLRSILAKGNQSQL